MCISVFNWQICDFSGFNLIFRSEDEKPLPHAWILAFDGLLHHWSAPWSRGPGWKWKCMRISTALNRYTCQWECWGCSDVFSFQVLCDYTIEFQENPHFLLLWTNARSISAALVFVGGMYGTIDGDGSPFLIALLYVVLSALLICIVDHRTDDIEKKRQSKRTSTTNSVVWTNPRLPFMFFIRLLYIACYYPYVTILVILNKIQSESTPFSCGYFCILHLITAATRKSWLEL